MTVFLSTLNQLAFLFSLIAIGYFLARRRIVPENSSAVLAKLENNLFLPALVLGTFMEHFTIERIRATWDLLLISFAVLAAAIPLSILVSRFITKDRYTQKIYTYGLSFSNFSFMGNAVVSALFPDIFFEYLLFTMPIWSVIYVWGVPALLIPSSGGKQGISGRLKAFLNPMFIAMFIGMILGLTKLALPDWMQSLITTSGSCMSPIAMLLSGMTISTISLRRTFTNVQLYAVSAFRLLIFPILGAVILMFLPVSETIRICTICSLAMPLGLNTIVVPSAYGLDTTVASGMALISHLLACITIPVIFMIFI